jgi:hypothetical protein
MLALKAALGNSQVWDAGDCRVDYLPAFARLHWSTLSAKTKKKVLETFDLNEDDIQAASYPSALAHLRSEASWQRR